MSGFTPVKSWSFSRSSTKTLVVFKGKKWLWGYLVCHLFFHWGKDSAFWLNLLLASGKALGRISQWGLVAESRLHVHQYCCRCSVGQYMSRKRSPGQQVKLARLSVMLTHQAWGHFMELVTELWSSRRDLKRSLFFLCLSMLFKKNQNNKNPHNLKVLALYDWNIAANAERTVVDIRYAPFPTMH